jgi:His/Glu/Gln/Arg/opine family amino acid ABC transporter permease subunit
MRWGPLLADLAAGTVTTLVVSLAGILIGMVLGLVLALARTGRVPIAAPLIATYVSVVRATPMVTLALLIFFGIPTFGLALSPLTAGIITLAVNTSAFQAEIWRAAIQDFPKGQLDAAKAAGMTAPVAFRRIVFPQAWRASLPALVNEFTLLVKASPAVAVIGVVDLTRVAVRVTSITYEPLQPFLTAALIYIVVVTCLIAAQRLIERAVVRKYGVL